MDLKKWLTPENKTILLNSFLAAAYTGLGAQASGLTELGPTVVFSILVGTVRGVIGVFMNRNGATLPMDQRAPKEGE